MAVVGILFAIAALYLIKILKDADKLQKKLNTGAGEILQDLKTAKKEISSVVKGGGAIYLLRVLVRLIGKTRRRIRRSKLNDYE